MKQIISLIFILIIFEGQTHAQRKIEYISTDTLLHWFKTKPPLEVLDKVLKSSKELDYKTCYQTQILKPYFIKWLDRNLWAEAYIQQLRKNLDPNYSYDSIDHWLDSISIVNTIKGRLKQQKSIITIDSILSTPFLFSIYKDSVINDNILRWIKQSEKRGKPYPSNLAIYYHSYLAYPESYTLIYKYWKETEGGMKNYYFSAMVRLGDPEARKLYDNFINKIVKENDGETIAPSFLGGTSYSTSKLIELLEVDKDISPFSDDNTKPYNCYVIKNLVSDIFYKKIEIDSRVKWNGTCKEHFKYEKEIKEAAQRLIEYYKVQEHYWMSNMPFYEK